jgi:CHAT domain-containing protein
LMARFYEAMFRENQSPAAALHQAQLSIRQHERWQSPFYWAAFVLQGEWR